MRYGIALVTLGNRKHQRYFDEYKDDGNSVSIDVRLLNGEWKTVNRKAVVRWPIKEPIKL